MLRWVATIAAAVVTSGITTAATLAQDLPPIQLSPANMPPECATPGRLMAFVRDANPAMAGRYADLATHYAVIGEELGVRWDYAFFQMLVETGNLTYRGDVKPQQNNFAGIGATGKGVRGESFPSVAEGVRAHLEHLLVYAGVPIQTPVADRTAKIQQWRVLDAWRSGLGTTVTYQHMTTKWAPTDRNYARTIQAVAERFLTGRCLEADPAPGLIAGIRSARSGSGVAAATAGAPESTTGPSLSTAPAGTNQRAALGVGAREPQQTAAREPATRSVSIINVPSGINAPSGASDARTPLAGAASSSALGLALPSRRTTSEDVKAASATPDQTSSASGANGDASVGRFASNLLAALTPPPAQTAVAEPIACRVWTASYGGQRALIIRSTTQTHVNYTVLDVNPERETREADAYIAAYAQGGQTIEKFDDQQRALERAFELCPDGKVMASR
ncbi:MAG: glucosaminidase domain-containing protein [Hyphomicrobiaceae bacterium]